MPAFNEDAGAILEQAPTYGGSHPSGRSRLGYTTTAVNLLCRNRWNENAACQHLATAASRYMACKTFKMPYIFLSSIGKQKHNRFDTEGVSQSLKSIAVLLCTW